MKKTLLIAALFAIAGFAKLDAQIVNNSFESWYLDTFYLPAGEISGVPADTISFYDPVGWTSSNSLTKLDSVGGEIFVTQSPNAFSGNWAIQMTTDTITIPLIAHLPSQKLIIPGFALNGIFPITAIKLNGSISVISPISVPGAGQPFTQRLQTINGYYNYKPAYNTLAHSNDTCIVWATLRKGSKLIANAIFKSTDSTGGYLPFSANFDYVACDIPDTLVVLVASSSPNVQNFLGLGNGLPAGSVLLIDSLTYDTLPASHHFSPFVHDTLFNVLKNSVNDTLDILAGDTDCSGQPLTATILWGPHHGTGTLLANYEVSYTPAANYSNLDTIYYRATNVNGDTSDARIVIYVEGNTGINEISQVQLNLYPVPADNTLHVQFQNPGRCRGNIYDIVGNLVLSTELNSNSNVVPVQNLPAGIYGIEVLNDENAVISRSKFVIAR